MDSNVRPSPWSTPRQSEYGEGFIEVRNGNTLEEVSELLQDEEGEYFVREMGDGEASSEDQATINEVALNFAKEMCLIQDETVMSKDIDGMASPRRRDSRANVVANATTNNRATKVNKPKVFSPAKKNVVGPLGNRTKSDSTFLKKGVGSPVKKNLGSLKDKRRISQSTQDIKGQMPSPKKVTKPLKGSRRTSDYDSSSSTVASSDQASSSATLTDPKSLDDPVSVQESLKLSPTKRRKKPNSSRRPRDIIELARPYSKIKSDDIKRWEKELRKNGSLDEESDQNHLLKEIAFTNALVLRVNQLAKQGLINKNQLFVFAIYVSHFEIQPQDRTKSSRSFYNFARQLTVIRDGIETGEQKSMFDLEEASWVPPMYVRDKPSRPPTSKPRDPSSYTFADEDIAKDYKKLWEEYQELQQLREREADQEKKLAASLMRKAQSQEQRK